MKLFILFSIPFIFFGCVNIQQHPIQSPHIKVEHHNKWCDGGALIDLTYSHKYKNELLNRALISLSNGDDYISIELGAPKFGQSLHFCVPNEYLDNIIIGITYGEQKCSGFVHSFSLKGVNNSKFDYMEIRKEKESCNFN